MESINSSSVTLRVTLEVHTSEYLTTQRHSTSLSWFDKFILGDSREENLTSQRRERSGSRSVWDGRDGEGDGFMCPTGGRYEGEDELGTFTRRRSKTHL